MSEWEDIKRDRGRVFGRDVGVDTFYGRHALREPGGDNVQRDVMHLIGERGRIGIHPTRLLDDYVGAHRKPVSANEFLAMVLDR